MTNENCGFLHYRTDPCRVATKSVSGRETDADSPLSRLPPKSASDDKSGRSQTQSTASRKDEPTRPNTNEIAEQGRRRAGMDSVMVWVMVLMLSGSGKAMTVPDVYYTSKEECVEAAKDAGRGIPDWVCIRGRR